MNDILKLSLRDRLAQTGGACRGEGLVPAPLDGCVWYVEQGSIELFLVADRQGRLEGARRHVMTAGAGQVVVFPTAPLDSPFQWAAAPAPESRWRAVARGDWIALLDDPAWHGEASAMLESQAKAMAANLQSAAPAGAIAMLPGREFAGTETALHLVPGAAGCWATLLRGSALYAGQSALAPGEPVPLPDRTWIVLAEDSVAECADGPALLARAGAAAMAQAYDQYLAMMHGCLVERCRQEEQDELLRLNVKSELGRSAMTDALGRFAALLGTRQGAAAAAGQTGVLAACKLIGERQGIGFKAVPFAGASGARHNPVREIAQASGVRTRTVALKGNWWRQDNGPLLGFRDEVPVALLPQRDGYLLVDPATGAGEPVTAEVARSLRPFGHMFYRPLPATQLRLPDIAAFIASACRNDIAVVLAAGLASAMLAMLIPLASGHLFDSVFPAADHGQMVQTIAVLFIASAATLLFEATRALAMLRIEGKAGSELQAAVWDRVLALPMPFFRDYSAGDLAMRINGINEIRQALSGPVIVSLVSNVFALLNGVLLFYFSTRLALAALSVTLLAVALNALLGYRMTRVNRDTAELNGTITGSVLEYLSGIAKLRMTGAETRAFARWAAGYAEQRRLAMRSDVLAGASAAAGAVLPLLGNALIFALLARQPGTERMSTGEFIAFCAAWSIFLGAALALVQTAISLASVRTTYERAKPLLEAVPEVDRSKAHPGALSGAIELSNVTFSYSPATPPVLDDISLSIRPGEFVALVGSSGSGKSTLLRLMLGFEQPSQGGIYYDGHHLDEIDVGAVRRQLGVVLQSGKLMSGDVYSNIVGSTGLTVAQAWEAAAACGLDADIKAMPMGMHTLVNDGGGGLSGGQRQRLLIARAIVHQPRILYFDEATSALDNQSQAIVSASMDKLKATRVVIAHRLSTIINADRIFVLDKGKLVQSGTYQELLGQDGLFAELARRQMV